MSIAPAYVATMCVAKCAPPSRLKVMRNAPANGLTWVEVACAWSLQLGVMTTKIDLLGNLRLEWRRVGRTQSARESCQRLAVRYPELELDAQLDLHDVVGLLETRG